MMNDNTFIISQIVNGNHIVWNQGNRFIFEESFDQILIEMEPSCFLNIKRIQLDGQEISKQFQSYYLQLFKNKNIEIEGVLVKNNIHGQSVLEFNFAKEEMNFYLFRGETIWTYSYKFRPQNQLTNQYYDMYRNYNIDFWSNELSKKYFDDLRNENEIRSFLKEISIISKKMKLLHGEQRSRLLLSRLIVKFQ